MTASTQIICRDCNNAFIYTDAERDFRESRGLTRPELCPECRGKERARRNGDLISLYQRADALDPFLISAETPGNGRNHRIRDTRQQYTTTCAACGSETRVPFVPRDDRPVYCRSCYNARKGR